MYHIVSYVFCKFCKGRVICESTVQVCLYACTRNWCAKHTAYRKHRKYFKITCPNGHWRNNLLHGVCIQYYIRTYVRLYACTLAGDCTVWCMVCSDSIHCSVVEVVRKTLLSDYVFSLFDFIALHHSLSSTIHTYGHKHISYRVGCTSAHIKTISTKPTTHRSVWVPSL